MRPIAFTMLLVTLSSIPALAQGSGRFWVAGAVLWDNDRSWNGDIPSTVGAGFSCGVDFLNGFGIELAGDWPVSRTITSIRTIQDPTLGLERVTSRVTLQSPSLSGAFRADFRSTPRLRVSALVGLAFVSHRSTFDTLVERATGNIEPVIKGRYPWWGPTGGLEVTVSLSRTVAIVPEIRAIFFPLAEGRASSAIFRPAIGLRREF